MIDIPLRERQFGQVLSFLDEQLGDSDVTVVFGDAAGGHVYFVSNRPLPGYQRHGGVYVKDATEAFEAARLGKYDIIQDAWRAIGFSRYDDMTYFGNQREPTKFESWALGVSAPYVWHGSLGFRSAASITFESAPAVYPDDCVICHEGTHGLILQHAEFIASYPLSNEMQDIIIEASKPNFTDAGTKAAVLQEAICVASEFDYARRFYPHILDDMARYVQAQSAYMDDSVHRAGARIFLSADPSLPELKLQICKRNRARKALI